MVKNSVRVFRFFVVFAVIVGIFFALSLPSALADPSLFWVTSTGTITPSPTPQSGAGGWSGWFWDGVLGRTCAQFYSKEVIYSGTRFQWIIWSDFASAAGLGGSVGTYYVSGDQWTFGAGYGSWTFVNFSEHTAKINFGSQYIGTAGGVVEFGDLYTAGDTWIGFNSVAYDAGQASNNIFTITLCEPIPATPTITPTASNTTVPTNTPTNTATFTATLNSGYTNNCISVPTRTVTATGTLGGWSGYPTATLSGTGTPVPTSTASSTPTALFGIGTDGFGSYSYDFVNTSGVGYQSFAGWDGGEGHNALGSGFLGSPDLEVDIWGFGVSGFEDVFFQPNADLLIFDVPFSAEHVISGYFKPYVNPGAAISGEIDPVQDRELNLIAVVWDIELNHWEPVGGYEYSDYPANAQPFTTFSFVRDAGEWHRFVLYPARSGSAVALSVVRRGEGLDWTALSRRARVYIDDVEIYSRRALPVNEVCDGYALAVATAAPIEVSFDQDTPLIGLDIDIQDDPETNPCWGIERFDIDLPVYGIRTVPAVQLCFIRWTINSLRLGSFDLMWIIWLCTSVAMVFAVVDAYRQLRK